MEFRDVRSSSRPIDPVRRRQPPVIGLCMYILDIHSPGLHFLIEGAPIVYLKARLLSSMHACCLVEDAPIVYLKEPRRAIVQLMARLLSC